MHVITFSLSGKCLHHAVKINVLLVTRRVWIGFFFYFGTVSVQFLKKLKIRFRMSLVRFGLKTRLSSDIVLTTLCHLYAKQCFGGVLKRSLSAH